MRQNNFTLEQKTQLISYDDIMDMYAKNELHLVQSLPCNLHSSSIRIDNDSGGIFIWSGAMQRYFLFAKTKN